jgi:hypothetical protein
VKAVGEGILLPKLSAVELPKVSSICVWLRRTVALHEVYRTFSMQNTQPNVRTGSKPAFRIGSRYGAVDLA